MITRGPYLKYRVRLAEHLSRSAPRDHKGVYLNAGLGRLNRFPVLRDDGPKPISETFMLPFVWFISRCGAARADIVVLMPRKWGRAESFDIERIEGQRHSGPRARRLGAAPGNVEFELRREAGADVICVFLAAR